MSVEHLSVVLHHSKQSGTDKVVMIGISNHHGDAGSWPSIATLTKYANVAPRNVQKSIRKCVAAGELEEIQRPGRSTLYRILVECPPDCSGGPRHRTRTDTRASSAALHDDLEEDADTTGTPIPIPEALAVEPVPSRPKPEKPARPMNRGCRLPEGWIPDVTVRDAMRKQYVGLHDDWWRREHEKFTNHFTAAPGQRGVKRDWNAAWRNWIHGAVERMPGGPIVANTTPASTPGWEFLKERGDSG